MHDKQNVSVLAWRWRGFFFGTRDEVVSVLFPGLLYCFAVCTALRLLSCINNVDEGEGVKRVDGVNYQ